MGKRILSLLLMIVILLCGVSAALGEEQTQVREKEKTTSRLRTIHMDIPRGSTVCVIVSDVLIKGTTGGFIRLGGDSAQSHFSDPVKFKSPNMFKIKADRDYTAVYVLLGDEDSLVYSCRVTAYIDGSIPHYSNFSVLGDSYTAYPAAFLPEGNISSLYIDQKVEGEVRTLTLEDVWWYRFASQYEISIIRNESYGGSRISAQLDENGTPQWKNAFIGRLEKIPKCELIFIFGGTNDAWYDVEIGDYVYEKWTASQLCQFRPAMAYMLDTLLKNHPEAQIVFIENSALLEDDQIYNQEIRVICGLYDVPVIPTPHVQLNETDHPNGDGMRQIAAEVIDGLVRLVVDPDGEYVHTVNE